MKEKTTSTLFIHLNPSGNQEKGTTDKINNVQSWGWSEYFELLTVSCSNSEMFQYPYSSVKKIKEVISVEEPKIKLVDKR